MKNRATFKHHGSLTLAVAMGVICPAGMSHAGDAVSGLNGKVQVVTGKVDGAQANAIAGSVSMPLASKFGVQVDALKGNNKTSGYGAHTFWRDADKGLVGVAASQVKVGDTKMQRLGIEGEYYLNNVTVSAEIGKQHGDVPKANQRRLDLLWYANDNLAFDLGATSADSTKRQHLGVEYQTHWKGVALFADAAQGSNHYDHLLAGATYYIGSGKSLKAHHRQDDPKNTLFDIAQSVSPTQAGSSASSTPTTPTTPNNPDTGTGGNGGCPAGYSPLPNGVCG